MKTELFNLKKWLVRVLVTIGGVLGFASCQHGGSATVGGTSSSTELGSSSTSAKVNEESGVEPAACVYGPPPEVVSGVEPAACVYGPPPEEVSGEEPVEIEPDPDV